MVEEITNSNSPCANDEKETASLFKSSEQVETARTTSKSDQSQQLEQRIVLDTVDDGLRLAGNFGKFQKFAAFVLIVGYMTGEIIV